MRFIRQSLMGLFLLSLTAGLLVFAVQLFSSALSERLSQQPRVSPQRERVFTVNVVTAKPQAVVPTIAVFGEIQSQRTLDLRAAASGAIVQMSDDFREGGQVKSGQVLVQIDTSDAQDALARAESELRASLAEVLDADKVLELTRDELTAAREQATLRAKALERQRDLETRGVGTAAAIENAELNLASARQQELARRQSIAQAEARVEQAATRLERAELSEIEAKRHLDDLQVVAEFDGTLAEVNAVKGGLVSGNERLARLIDPNALEVTFRVSTAQYARLLDQSGQLRAADISASLNVSGFVLQAQGKISRDSASVGDGQTGRMIFATLENAGGLKPGDFVSVSISEDILENIVRMPASALNAQGHVMVVGDDDRLQTLNVKLIRRQGDDVLLAGKDLAGKKVVTRLTPLLGAGIRVRVNLNGGEPSGTEPSTTPELLELSEERRAKLVAFVEGNSRMPAERKQRMLNQLSKAKVPAQFVNRLEQRIGG